MHELLWSSQNPEQKDCKESISLPENLNTGNWVCLGTRKNSSPWEPPVSHRYGEGSCLSTYPPIYTLHSLKEYSPFQSSGMETLGEKRKSDTPNPEMDSILGCWYSGDRAQAGQLKKLGVCREEGRRKRPDGACQASENCPKHLRGLGWWLLFWAKRFRVCPSCFCFICH